MQIAKLPTTDLHIPKTPKVLPDNFEGSNLTSKFCIYSLLWLILKVWNMFKEKYSRHKALFCFCKQVERMLGEICKNKISFPPFLWGLIREWILFSVYQKHMVWNTYIHTHTRHPHNLHSPFYTHILFSMMPTIIVLQSSEHLSSWWLTPPFSTIPSVVPQNPTFLSPSAAFNKLQGNAGSFETGFLKPEPSEPVWRVSAPVTALGEDVS